MPFQIGTITQSNNSITFSMSTLTSPEILNKISFYDQSENNFPVAKISNASNANEDEDDDDDEVTHERFFGENIKRVLKGLSRSK